jgi:hypothetical protein
MTPTEAAGRGRLAVLLAAAALAGACASPVTRTPIRDAGLLDLQGRCSQSEPDGFREDARLSVDRGTVQALDWDIRVGRRGSCSFRFADFRQVRSRPHIELHALDRSGCKLMVYQDPRRVTLGHAGCAARCTGGVEAEAWPVMFDPRTGGCADLNR